MLVPAKAAAEGPGLRVRRSLLPAQPPPGRWQRTRRIAAGAAAALLIPVLASYIGALTQRSDSSLGIRTVEWIRDNGARGLVNRVESIYYSLTAPSTGGPALQALPHQAGALAAALNAANQVHQRRYRPQPLQPVIAPALPGEGTWHATFAGGGSTPPVLITSFRPDPRYPRTVAGVAWIDHTRTNVVLYPGIKEPAVGLADRGPQAVPMATRPKLVATFNSGFKLADSGGGFALAGHTYAPLKDGLATIVRYTGGNVDVIAWTGGPSAPVDVVYARQNLPLIVNNGRPNPNLSDGPEWGATLGNKIRVWRSAVGVDAHGNLIYAAANYQTVGSLATIMLRAGAVRAMELDINNYWTSFITYRYPGAGHPANLVPDMVRPADRYLTADDRDFFAVYVR